MLKKILPVILALLLLVGAFLIWGKDWFDDDKTDTPPTTLGPANPTGGDGTQEQNPIDCSKGHSYIDEVTPSTCTQKGYTTHTCTVCGDQYVDAYIDAGHSYNTVVVPPTCIQKGYTTYTCTVCNDSYADHYVDPTDHSYQDVVTAPTCTQRGYTTHTCAACNDSYVDTYVSVVDHIYVSTIISPTCTKQGYTSHRCSVCGDSYVNQYVDSVGHTEVVDPAKEPTATQTGLTAGRHCSVCNTVLVKQEVIPALGNLVLSNLTCNSSGYYELRTVQDLKIAARHPGEKYILMQNIDFQGAQWTPVENYSGIFDGNYKTLSNITIRAAGSDGINMGFFATIATKGTVKNLNLQNVSVQASSTSARNIGTIAGTCDGQITNCTATGTITDTRTSAGGQNILVGCFAGKAGSKAAVKGGTKISVKDNGGIYNTSGLSADVKLFVADSKQVIRGFVGSKESGSQVSGLWRDSFYSSERLSASLQERQETVVSYMYKMGTVAWTVPVTMTHKGDPNSSSIHDQTFVPGQIYYGIPYDHTAASLEHFMYCLDANNKVQNWVVQELGTTSVWGTGDPKNLGFTIYMGNDCSSAVGWAWMQVSPSQVSSSVTGKYEGGVYVLLTTQMIPNNSNRNTYGIYPVGNWNGYNFTTSKGVYLANQLTMCSQIVSLNGKDVIYEAYAQTRKGDALIYGEPGGHARLVAEDPVVIRDGDGSIDVDKSYFITHEQGDGLYNNKYEGTNSSWRINYRYTFNVLMNGSKKLTSRARYLEAGSGNGYLPITIRAMRDSTVSSPLVGTYPMGEVNLIVSPSNGGIYSNYRILNTTVTVKDSNGRIVYDKLAFVGSTGEYDIFRGVGTTVELSTYHADAVKNLPAGTYTFTVQATLSNGSVHTVVKDQVYQKK